jgi:hypothetical protein
VKGGLLESRRLTAMPSMLAAADLMIGAALLLAM